MKTNQTGSNGNNGTKTHSVFYLNSLICTSVTNCFFVLFSVISISESTLNKCLSEECLQRARLHLHNWSPFLFAKKGVISQPGLSSYIWKLYLAQRKPNTNVGLTTRIWRTAIPENTIISTLLQTDFILWTHWVKTSIEWRSDVFDGRQISSTTKYKLVSSLRKKWPFLGLVKPLIVSM